ncbi:MAG: phosphate ABC transporter substrate-binding protein [Nitrospirae bacterium]|nr:phosphate ABC transporter substrate-binding protein [Nitrospirota bacterium]
MEKIFAMLFLVSLLFLSADPGLGAQETKNFDGVIRIGGSTTLLPVIADAATQFMEKYKTWDKIDHSLPAVPVIIYVTGGGSGFGVRSVIDGTNHIGMASRDIEEKEKAQLGNHKEFLVSKDCIAFAVNKRNPLAKRSNLTKEEVARIYSGEAKTFRDIDAALPGKPILVQMRDAAGGSTEIMQREILKERTFTPSAVQVPSQGVNLKKLETNTSAIAYISSVIALENPQLKVLKFEGVAPSNENVINGKYRLTRPLLLLVKDTPDPAVQMFIDYMLAEGQKVVVDHGYVPVKTVKK